VVPKTSEKAPLKRGAETYRKPLYSAPKTFGAERADWVVERRPDQLLHTMVLRNVVLGIVACFLATGLECGFEAFAQDCSVTDFSQDSNNCEAETSTCNRECLEDVAPTS